MTHDERGNLQIGSLLLLSRTPIGPEGYHVWARGSAYDFVFEQSDDSSSLALLIALEIIPYNNRIVVLCPNGIVDEIEEQFVNCV